MRIRGTDRPPFGHGPGAPPHSLPVLLLRHPQAEGLQDTPQLLGLHPARLVHVDEVEGADHGFNVFINLRIKAI